MRNGHKHAIKVKSVYGHKHKKTWFFNFNTLPICDYDSSYINAKRTSNKIWYPNKIKLF